MNRPPPAAQTDRPRPQAPAGPADARWQVRLLGGFLVRGPRQTHTRFPSRATTALLARLALQPGREHGREELVELLWPGVELAIGRNRLRQALSTLKALLEPPGAAPVIVADRRALRVAPGALGSDVQQFESLLRAGLAQEAAALYGGELLPGFFDEWILDERRRLAALAERLPQPAAATVGAPAPAAAVPAALPALSRHALPAYLTRYFGAGAQAARLARQVGAHRLVTLVGPGGIGKTRLAVELALALRDDAPGADDVLDAGHARFDLVAFVALADCRSPAAMLDALGQAFGLQAMPDDVIDRLADCLAGQRALLVLDNLEQLLPPGAALAARLLARAPGLHLLVTSRRVLGIDGEREFVLAPLPPPCADADLAESAANPAMALFADRARAVRADFHLGPRNIATVAALVELLGGLPLAIELAAARVRSIGVGEMLDRLRVASGHGAPGGGLALLSRAGPRAGLDARHASMAQVVEWSWTMLPQAVQATLARLTVFAGGFDTQAAAALIGPGPDVPLQLDEAVQHSLLSVERQPDDRLRFHMSEPVREFALGQLPESERPALRQRHRDWWPRWAAAFGPTAPLAALRAEMPNLVAALASAHADGVPEQGVHLMLALRTALKEVPLPGSGIEHLRQALQACADVRLRSAGLSLLATLEFDAGLPERARGHIDEALRTAAPGSSERVHALQVAIYVIWTGTHDRTRLEPLFAEAEALAQDLGERAVLASLLGTRAYALHHSRGDWAGALALFERAVQLWQELGNRHAQHNGLYHLANAAQAQGRLQDAERGFVRVCELARAEHDATQLSMAANALGNVLVRLRRWREALPRFLEAAEVAWLGNDMINWSYAVWNLPSALVRCREPEEAQRLMAFAAEHWSSRFGALTDGDRRQMQRIGRLARAQADARRGALLEQEGRAWSPPEAMRRLRAAVARAVGGAGARPPG